MKKITKIPNSNLKGEIAIGDLFRDTLKGLLQAVNIEKGYISVERIPDLPAETHRVEKSYEEVNIEQFVMPTTQRALNADEYVRGLRDNDRI